MDLAEQLSSLLDTGGRLRIKGVGVFFVRIRTDRRIVLKGKQYRIPVQSSIGFRPAKHLKKFHGKVTNGSSRNP